MVLNLSKVLMLLSVFGIGVAKAQNEQMDEKFLRIHEYEISKIETDVFNQETALILADKQLDTQMLYEFPGMPDQSGKISVNEVGQVISIMKDLVALGEDIYTLVQKGKPSNKTSYTPISVMPAVNGQPIDVLETENWQMPYKHTYQITYKNVYGMVLIKFRYSILFSYGGSYNGKGAYITGAQIIPEAVDTSFGFDFTATMKLQSIQNHGTKENPIAGAVITMEYSVQSVLQASLSSESYHITGKGQFKQL